MSKKGRLEDYYDLSSGEYFAHNYLGQHRSFMRVRVERAVEYLKRYCKNIGRMRVLDAGCGPGVLMARLGGEGCDVTGIDLSTEMLKLASTQLADSRAVKVSKLVRSDIEKLPFKENSFDVVVTLGVIEHLESDDNALREFKRVLREDGLLVISVTNKYAYTLIIDGVIELLKRNEYCSSVMNYVNGRVLKRGHIRPSEFRGRRHSAAAFRRVLNAWSFIIEDDRYFYYAAVPHPLNGLMRGISEVVGRGLEGLGKTGWGFVGEGYLVVCRNVK